MLTPGQECLDGIQIPLASLFLLVLSSLKEAWVLVYVHL